jgi:AraC-like DNA-binding protein
MKSSRAIKKLHAMKEFGTVYGETELIRANRLEKRLKPLVPFPHRHAFYHLVAITSGTGWHEIDFERYSVSSEKIYFMKPGQVHSWHLSDDTQGYVIEFEESAIPAKGPEAAAILQILDSTQPHYALPMASGDHVSKVFELLRFMVNEYDDQAANFELALKHYLIALLIELSRKSTEKSQPLPNSDSMLEGFFKLIELHFQKQHEVSFYSQKLGATSKSLTMRALRAYGKSARAFIQDRLVLECRRMLAYSNLSVAEVGYELGFEDPNYFTRFFREHVGMAPGEFRSKVRHPA